jgi:hypothetical protein
MAQDAKIRRYAPPASLPRHARPCPPDLLVVAAISRRCFCECVRPPRTSSLGIRVLSSCVHAYAIVTAAPPGLVQAQTQKLRLRTGRRTYHVVGMVPYGNIDYKDPNHLFNRKHRPALAQYLTQVVGTKFDPPVNFTIRVEVCSPCASISGQCAFTQNRVQGVCTGRFPQRRLVRTRAHTSHSHTPGRVEAMLLNMGFIRRPRQSLYTGCMPYPKP